VRIAFHSNQLGLRGTEVALYDYANYNEELLGNESLIVYPKHAPGNHPKAIERFKSRFTLHPYDNFAEVDRLVDGAHIDTFYAIKAGSKDGVLASGCKNSIHAVFPLEPLEETHGDRFAFVSEWLSKHCSNGRTPYVPHIVTLPPPQYNLRAHLDIPADAFVVGGYGGEDSFDVPFAPQAIREALEKRSNLFFLFLNFKPFIRHERVVFLPGSSSTQLKADLVEACDAMLHARLLGESFGLACGEFSIRNKPVMTYGSSPQQSHLDILGDKAMKYYDQEDLQMYLEDLDKEYFVGKNWDAYSKHFNPEVVMSKFKEVFLS
jgi:hypothetical protein